MNEFLNNHIEEEAKTGDAAEKGNLGRREFLKKALVLPAVIGGLNFLDRETKKAPRAKHPETNRLSKHENSQELEKVLQEALEIIRTNDVKAVIKNKYLVAALYYSENFFKKIKRLPKDDPEADSGRILLAIKDAITSGFRAAFVQEMELEIKSRLGTKNEKKLVKPVKEIEFRNWQNNHDDALDLFIKEGSEVSSMVRGMVVLAEAGWEAGNLYSIISRKGGNCVIVYNPEYKQFYRYCHLNRVLVGTGDVVLAGQKIGSVGHTGLNASKPGHGEHLHLEINQFDAKKNKVFALRAAQVVKILEKMD